MSISKLNKESKLAWVSYNLSANKNGYWIMGKDHNELIKNIKENFLRVLISNIIPSDTIYDTYAEAYDIARSYMFGIEYSQMLCAFSDLFYFLEQTNDIKEINRLFKEFCNDYSMYNECEVMVEVFDNPFDTVDLLSDHGIKLENGSLDAIKEALKSDELV